MIVRVGTSIGLRAGRIVWLGINGLYNTGIEVGTTCISSNASDMQKTQGIYPKLPKLRSGYTRICFQINSLK